MRLSEESIKNVLDLLKKKLPLVYCSCGIERLSDLSRGIIYYNGKVKSKLDKDNDEFKNINTLLIFLDEIRDKNIIDIEKKLIAINKKGVVLLEAKGIDEIIYKRNLAFSLINRYNINILKGTKEEINSLIALEDNEKNKNFNYRNFAKTNDCILIIKDKKYYITDGYSEFYIKNKNKYFNDEEYIDNIYTGVLASSIGICNNKSEIIQSVLISTLSFYIAQEASIELFKYQFEDDIDKNDINLVNEYLLEEMSKINVDKIKSYGDVEYYFKRNR